MISYILRRLFYSVFVLLAVATIVFFIARLTGDPVAIMMPADATTEQLSAYRVALGFDKPLGEQYLTFISKLVRLDLGNSIHYDDPTLGLIIERLPATIELAMTALILSLVVAIPAGILAALKRGSLYDQGIMIFVLLGQSMPVFWLGIILVLIFAVSFHWLPTGGYGSWKQLILPAVTLGLRLMALVARLTRSSLIEVLETDYIRTARAKGLLPFTVIAKHALRNSLLPIVTIVGMEIGSLLGGAVVTEIVFAWPGVGQLLIQAIDNRDFPLVQGIIIMMAFIIVFINLMTDISYVFIDPRIKYK